MEHEFQNRTYAKQSEHLYSAQHYGRVYLDYIFRSFGAPCNQIDETTLSLINENEEIKVWLYGNPMTNKLNLPVGLTNIEFPTHIPVYQKFSENYNSNEKVSTLQFHPDSWDNPKFIEFTKIIEFLETENATFLKPFEYYQYNQPMP